MPDVTLVIETDEETSNHIKQEFERTSGGEVISARRESLDGGLATFLTILRDTAPIISAAAPLIIELLRQKKVRRIKLGDLEIDGPTEKQWEFVWREFEKKAGKESS